MSNANTVGKFQLQPADLSVKDISTIRRMLGGVHEMYVIAALSNPTTLGNLLSKSKQVTNIALEKASAKN